MNINQAFLEPILLKIFNKFNIFILNSIFNEKERNSVKLEREQYTWRHAPLI